jgi:flagellar protein FlgJ
MLPALGASIALGALRDVARGRDASPASATPDVSAPRPAAAGGTERAPRRDDDAALRQAAVDMNAVFMQQLLKAMRDTVPAEGGIVPRGQGEELFTGLMDERIAADTSAQWKRGLGDAIYRALRHRAGLDARAPEVVPPSPDPTP